MKPSLFLSATCLLVFAAFSKHRGNEPMMQDAATASIRAVTVPNSHVGISLPVIPFLLEYQYAPLHLQQWIEGHPAYSAIEAIVEQGSKPIYEVILTERASRRRTYYSTDASRVALHKLDGKDAVLAPIDFKSVINADAVATYGLALQDRNGVDIRWRFIPATTPSERGAGLTPLPAVPCLRIEYRELGTAAGQGSAVRIGETTIEADPWPEISAPPYFIAYRGSISSGRHLGGFFTGTTRYRAMTSPTELVDGAKWRFSDSAGRTRLLRVRAKKGEWFEIVEDNESTGGELARLSLEARWAEDHWSLREIRLTHGSTTRLAFNPPLDLGSAGTEVTGAFQIDQGKASRVVSGTFLSSWQTDGLKIVLRPRAPEWTKERRVESVIRLYEDGYEMISRQSR